MAFSINTDGLPHFDSYKQAARWEAEVKPIRGRYPECKPIGPRNKTHMTIRRAADGDILCRLHHTDVLTFHPDDSVTLYLNGWNSNSTFAFVNAILGWRTRIGTTHGHTTMDGCYIDEAGETHYGTFAIPDSDPVGLTRDANSLHYRIHNPLPTYKHLINRKAMNKVRKECAAALTYFDSMLRVRAESNGRITLENHRYETWGLDDASIFRCSDIQILATELERGLNVIAARDWRTGTYYTTRSHMLTLIDTNLKSAFKDEVTRRVQNPWGKVMKDPNPWAA